MKSRSASTVVRCFFALLLLLAAGIAARCQTKEDAQTSTATVDTSATGPLPVAGPPIGDIAKEISKGVGTVLATNDGGPERIIVFEETHASRIGQVEIATMLVRLHDRYGMRRVALEGAFADEGPLPAKWFHDLGVGPASKDVAVHLVREGEIGACEFTALVYPDVQVTGSENKGEYAVTLTDRAERAPFDYLMAIAEKSLSQDQIVEANRLITQKQHEEAINYILNASDWTKERYAKLTDDASILSTEELLAILNEVQSKAGEVGAEVDDDMRSGVTEAADFYRMADRRTGTMVRNALALTGGGSAGIVAMNIGAAHTQETIAHLKTDRATFAVIRPASLASHDKHGAMTSAAYHRKDVLASVDVQGLGSYLDGRSRHHKPQSVLGQPWLRSKAGISYAATLFAMAAAGGAEPPFNDIQKQLAAYDGIRVDPTSVETIDEGGRKAVIFKVVAKTGSGDVELWVKSAQGSKEPPSKPPVGGTTAPASSPDEPERSLEQMLLDERKELSKEEVTEEKKGEADEPPRDAILLPITRDVMAVIGKSRDAVRNKAI